MADRNANDDVAATDQADQEAPATGEAQADATPADATPEDTTSAETTPADTTSADTPPAEPASATAPEAPTAPAPSGTAGESPLSQDELRAAFAPAPGTEGEGEASAEPMGVAVPGDEPVAVAPPTGPGLGTGRRKEAVVRVRLIPGEGRYNLNGRSLEEYFPARAHRMQVSAPLRTAGRDHDFDVIAKLHGGGVSGQAGALQLGIARALLEIDGSLRPALKADGMLTRDAREKERRKYGLKKARKAPQYSKR